MSADSPKASVSILIRKSAEEIFPYFVEPALLQKFWLGSAEGPLQVGKAIRWEFMVPGAIVTTTATELIPGKVLAWNWDEESKVRIEYEKHGDLGTRVHVTNWGFPGTAAEQVETAIESTQGFTYVLCDLKTLLENGRSFNLVKDKARLIQDKQAEL